MVLSGQHINIAFQNLVFSPLKTWTNQYFKIIANTIHLEMGSVYSTKKHPI